MHFYYKSTCSTCRKARAVLLELGASFEERDMSRQPLSAAELESLIGERDIIPFLNTRNEMYRERKMKLNPPSKPDAIALMAENANLIRRPILVIGNEMLFGFDETEYRRRFAQ